MKNISLCFQIHHPFHFQTFRFLEIGGSKSCYDDLRTEREINEAAINYYLPSNEFLLKLIKKSKGKLNIAFYISGTAIDQFLMYEPEVLTSFRLLADTGQVEFLGGTSSHSIVSLSSHKDEFVRQAKDYRAKIEHLFGIKPSVFVNSDLIYSDLIGLNVVDAGYNAMITNGSRKTLGWQSSNYVYSNCLDPKMHVYFRNEQISDELAANLFRMNSEEKEINTTNFIALINNLDHNEPILNIYLDYKSLGGFGIAKKQKYFQKLVSEINKINNVSFVLPSEIKYQCGPVAQITAGEPICWRSNVHSDYYPGNDLQQEAINQLYKHAKMVSKIDDLNLHKDWQYLQTSDHIHFMDDQHPSYSENSNLYHIYKSKYEAFINFMNILDDFSLRINEAIGKKAKKQAGINVKSRKRRTTTPIYLTNNLRRKRKKSIDFFA